MIIDLLVVILFSLIILGIVFSLPTDVVRKGQKRKKGIKYSKGKKKGRYAHRHKDKRKKEEKPRKKKKRFGPKIPYSLWEKFLMWIGVMNNPYAPKIPEPKQYIKKGEYFKVGNYEMFAGQDLFVWKKGNNIKIQIADDGTFTDENGNVFNSKNGFINHQKMMGKTSAEAKMEYNKLRGKFIESRTNIRLAYAWCRRKFWKLLRVFKTYICVRYKTYWKYNRRLNKIIPRNMRNVSLIFIIMIVFSFIISPLIIIGMIPVIGIAVNSNTNEIYVEDYRNAGYSDADTIQAAVNDAYAKWSAVPQVKLHSHIVFENGRLYDIQNTTIVLYDEMTLEGLKCKLTHNTNIDVLTVNGTAPTPITVNANINAYQSTAVLTGIGHGLANRDFLLVYDDTLKYPLSSVKQGEFVEIQGNPVEGANTTYNIKEQYLYSYNIGLNAEVRKVNFVRHVNVKDMDFLGIDEFTDTGDAIRFNYAKDCILDNLTFLDFGERSSMFVGCYGIKNVTNVYDYSNMDGLGYGVAAADAGRDIIVIGCSFSACRHAVTHGGGVTGLGWVQESSVNDSEMVDSAYDSHPEVGDSLQISNCFIMFRTSVGGSRNMSIRGGRITITNCTCVGAQTDAIRFEGYSLQGTVVGCRLNHSLTKGIHMDPDTSGQYSIESCIISNCGDDGIYSLPPGSDTIDLSVINCVMVDNGGSAIDIRFVTCGSITGNVCKNNVGWAIILVDEYNVDIVGNTIIDDQIVHTQYGIYIFRDTGKLNVSDNYILNSANNAIHADGSNIDDISINSNLIITPAIIGVRVDSTITNASIESNHVISSTSYGFYIQSDYAEVNGNRCYGGTIGYYIAGTSLSINSNKVIDNNGDGIYLYDTTDSQIVGNYCSGSTGGSGIYDRTPSSGSMIHDNYCLDNSSNGIYAFGDNASIRGNILKDNAGFGVRLSSSADGTIIIGNEFYNNTSGPIYNIGTNTRRESNIGDTPRFHFYDDFVNPIFDTANSWILSGQTWNFSTSGGATVANANVNSGAIRSTTAAVNGRNNTIYTGTNFPFNPANHCCFCANIDLGSTTLHNLVVGFYQDATHYITFRSTAGGNIMCDCQNGGLGTMVDSGIAQDTNTKCYKLEILDDGSVNFYYSTTHWEDMTFITNISTNVPSGQFQPYVNHQTNENVAKYLDLYRFYVCQQA